MVKLNKINQLKNLKDKVVLVRFDADVPLKPRNGNGYEVADDSRLRASLKTIEYLISNNAKIVLIGHMGRPKGKKVAQLSLKPVADRINILLRQTEAGRVVSDVLLVPIERYIGERVKKIVAQMDFGEIIMLENIRFSDREEVNCKRFAKKLADLGDIYVNEAFANCHRSHASVDAIQDYIPSYAGFNLDREVSSLAQVIDKPKKPVLFIFGGAKTETKIPVIKNYINKADYIIVGGVLANTFLKALGYDMGKSKIDDDYVAKANFILKQLDFKYKDISSFTNRQESMVFSSKFFLPVDVKLKTGRVKQVGQLKANDNVLDIGPQTVIVYKKIIRTAKTIVWNGPMGKIEEKGFCKGSSEILSQIVLNKQAKVVIGGGDTIKILNSSKVYDKVFISSGGGAMLDFLAGKKMPGLRKLLK